MNKLENIMMTSFLAGALFLGIGEIKKNETYAVAACSAIITSLVTGVVGSVKEIKELYNKYQK